MSSPKPARNAPCPCGSGRRYRKCCGAADATAHRAGTDAATAQDRTKAERPHQPRRLHRTIVMGGVAALAFTLYSGVFSAPFIYDDLPTVRDNRFVQDPANLLAFWRTPYPPDRPELGLFRPVTATSYLADFVVWGADAGGFHVTNALLHAVASALCVGVVWQLGAGLPAAAIAGLIFAVHPVHTEAVAWIVGRAEVLAALGCLGACLAWVRFRRTGRTWPLLLAVGLYFLALGAKETAAPLPAVLLLADWLGVWRCGDSPGNRPAAVGAAGLERASFRGSRTRLLLPQAGFLVAFAAYAALRIGAVGAFGMLRDTVAFAGEPTSVRLLSGVAVVGQYARLCVLPSGLRVDYGDLRFDSLTEGPVVLGLAVMALLFGGGWLLRRRQPIVALWAGWFLLFVLPFSNLLVSIGAVAAERIVYVGSLGACALAGVGLAKGIEAGRPLAVRLGAGAAVLALALGFSVGTVTRAADWRDPIQLFRVETERSPRSEKARMNLGLALWARGKATGDRAMLEEAGAVFREGIALGSAVGHTMTGDHPRLLYHYATLLQEGGRAADAVPLYARIAELHERYAILRKDMPADYHVWYGAALEAVGRPDEARAQYELALARKPRWMVPLRNIAQLAWKQGKREEAVALYRRAIEADPTASSNYAALGVLLAELSRHDDAQAVLAKLRQSAPSTAEGLYYRGMLAQRLGRVDEAATDYRRALEVDPQRADARKALTSLGTN